MGNSSNIPFLPGGFDKEMNDLFSFSNCELIQNEQEDKFIDFLGNKLFFLVKFRKIN